MLNVDRKLWVVEDAIPRILLHADVIGKNAIDAHYDLKTARLLGIEDFAKSKAVPRPSQV